MLRSRSHFWLLIFGSICAGAVACGAPNTETAPIKEGLTREAVIEALGEPMGTIQLSDKTLYLYPRGEVTLEAGRVTRFDLMEEAAYRIKKERQRIEREEWQAAQEKRAERHREAGLALKAERMQSAAFAGLPAKDRVDFWRRFQERFPGIDISEQLATALQGYEVELAELQSQERISNLEARVAQAEREAAAARLETEKLRKETEALRNSARYGLRYYTDPIIRTRPHHYRPPTVTIHSNGTTTTTQTESKRNLFAPKYRYINLD